MRATASTVRILDEDPELAMLVAPDELGDAAERLVAPVVRLGRGRWPEKALGGDHDAIIGVLVLEGALALRATHAGRSHLEVLGPGDVAQPWLRLSRNTTVMSDLGWRVLVPTRLAVLDERFAAAAAAHPQILTAVIHRVVLRARRLGVQTAIISMPRVSDRVLRMLWALADRFGRMGPEGAFLDLPLSHRDLADLVAARRPTVSTAITQLAREGRLQRTGRTWFLPGPAPSGVEPGDDALLPGD